MKDNYDVIIVGAGPAGCSAANFIAKQGWSVLLVDKAEFPRDKTCGDGISATSIAVLERMGVLNEILALKPQIIDNIIVSAPNGSIMTGKNTVVPGLSDHGYVIPRKEFDHKLFEFVRQIPGVDVRQGFPVKDLIRDKSAICGIIGDNEQIRGRIIIGADGVHSMVARKMSLQKIDKRHRAFAMRAYFDNVSGLTNAIEIHNEESILPGYAWIFPVGPNSANVGIGIGTWHADNRSLKGLFETFLAKNCFAREKFKNAVMRKNTLKSWPLPFGSLKMARSKNNVLLLGDAASFVDVLTGEGIYFALRSGEFAAMAVSTALQKQGKENIAGHIYEKLWKKEFKWKDFIPGYMLQPIASNKHLLNFSIKRASHKQKNADVLAGVIAHKMSKYKLLFNF